MWRILLSLFSLVCAVLGQERLPNVILIFCDDLGYGDIAAQGAKYATPHLDRLGRAGRRFTNFHVSSAVCSASRAALLTGAYHGRVGIHGALSPGAKMGLHPQETTLAEALKARGYATGMAGKWHLGDVPEFLPTRQGFDEWLGLPYSNDMWPHHPEMKPGRFPPLPLYDGERIINADVTGEDQRMLTTRYTERAVSFIQRHKARPFFFYLAHAMPHVPLYVSERFAGKSGVGLYGDVVQEIDWSLGEILDALEKNGIARDTWVIFTSDNGPWLSYGEHGGSAGGLREGKGTSWQGGTRVPCLMAWPGQIPAGTTSDALWMTIDLFPTIAARCGAALPPLKIDGQDRASDVFGTPAPGTREYGWWYANNQLQAVTDGRWKLIFPHTYHTMGGQPLARGGIPGKYSTVKIETPQLYDIQADFAEAHDLANQHPAEVQRLQKIATRLRETLGDSLTNTPPTEARPPGKLD